MGDRPATSSTAPRRPTRRPTTHDDSEVAAHHVVVVDGSNIATEGRSHAEPEAAQRRGAGVPRASTRTPLITVVVDATFGHRIDKQESGEFDDAVAHNELVAPPAGAIGRGDAFVLSIANKVGATHPQQRLVPGVPRQLPVAVRRGPPHRRQAGAQRRLGVRRPAAGQGRRQPQGAAGRARGRTADAATKPLRRTASKEASQPMPVPTAPPPGCHGGAGTAAPRAGGRRGRSPAASAAPSGRIGQRPAAVPRVRRAPPGREQRQRRGRVVLVARRLRVRSATCAATCRCG